MKDNNENYQHEHPLKTLGGILISPVGLVLLIVLLVIL